MRTGQPAFRKHSPDGDAFSSFDAEQAAIFDAAMATFAPQTAAAIAAAYDFSQFGTVMDVGGGNGALLIGILGANPRLRGIVFDRPQAADGAKREGRRGRASPRAARWSAGDFFEAVPEGADAYLLKHVIHDWNDEQATRDPAQLPPRDEAERAKLLIAEGVYPARIDTSLASRGAAANDVNMLVVAGGRQRSEEEFRSLYDGRGLHADEDRSDAEPGLCLIEGVPR